MTKYLFIDVETYSSVDIKTCGAYKYIESPDFEILIFTYGFDKEPLVTVDLVSGEKMPKEFIDALLDPNIIKVAHNAVFERLSFKKYGYDVPAIQWYCTSVKSAYCGLPLSLDGVSKALDLKDKKLATGKALIKYFSCPCKPTKINGGRTRNYPKDAPKKWEMYKEYNKYDVLSEREIFYRLDKIVIPQFERKMYALDQGINDRGILIDMDLAKSAIAVNTEYSEILTARAKKLTGLENPNSGQQIIKWIKKETGRDIESLNKKCMPDLYKEFENYPKVLELLDIRKQLSKTSVKKYYTMERCAMADNRVRGTFQFYGANRTGRWAGRLLQLQNLSKNHVPHIEVPRELIKKRDWDAVELMYGDVMDILSQLVRTALIAPKGKVFSVADFSAIEARVISWLSNEKWRLDVFHGDGKIYEATGSKMFGVPVSAIKKGTPLRDKSKISELALGYEGGLGALKQMGGEKMGLTELEMLGLIRKWRDANPAIVKMWKELENGARESVRYHRKVVCTCRNIVFDCDGEYMTVLLPSGRSLYYYHPKFRSKIIGNSPRPSTVLSYQGVIQATRQWGYLDTYGGKLTENTVQAIARDLLCNSMTNLDAHGYHPVCHIHDEVLCEVPEEGAKGYYDDMVRIMSTPPAWAADLPLRADGYTTPFYLKD